jgi:hypothetical protein
MSDRGFYTFALIAAILSMAAWIVYIVFNSSGPDYIGLDDSGQAFQILWESRNVTYAYGWGGSFGAFLVIPYMLAYQYAFRHLGPWFWLATATTVIGSVLTALGFMAGSLTLVYSLVPLGLNASPNQVDALFAATQVVGELIEVTWFVGSFLAFSVGIGLFAYATLRLAPVAKWISVVGIVAGISGVAWLSFFFPALESIAPIPRIVNILGIFIWSIAMAVVVRRNAAEWDSVGSLT